MVYKVRRIWLADDGTVRQRARRAKLMIWPVDLVVGGKYFLERGALYIVEGEWTDDAESEIGPR